MWGCVTGTSPLVGTHRTKFAQTVNKIEHKKTILVYFIIAGSRCDNIRDFKQRQWGRRRERHKIRKKPKGPLRMTGGKQVDVLRRARRESSTKRLSG